MEYTASYTGAGLLYNEFTALQPILELPDWKKQLAQDVLENNLLKINSEASRKRVATEIMLRMKHMDGDFWGVYKQTSEMDKKSLLFYVCLQTYKLMYDFHFNVTVPKFLSLETMIQTHWYEMRLQQIAATNEKVDGWSVQTKRKLITAYINILNKTGLSQDNNLLRLPISNVVLCFCLKRGDQWALDAFFLKDHEKETIINSCNDN